MVVKEQERKGRAMHEDCGHGCAPPLPLPPPPYTSRPPVTSRLHKATNEATRDTGTVAGLDVRGDKGALRVRRVPFDQADKSLALLGEA